MVAKSTPRAMEVIARGAANDRREGRPVRRKPHRRWVRHLQGLVQSVTEKGQPARSDGAFLDDEAALTVRASTPNDGFGHPADP